MQKNSSSFVEFGSSRLDVVAPRFNFLKFLQT